MPHDSVAANGAQFDFDFDAADEETYSVSPTPLYMYVCLLLVLTHCQTMLGVRPCSRFVSGSHQRAVQSGHYVLADRLTAN